MPWVVIGLIIANSLVFILTLAGNSEQIYRNYGFVPSEHVPLTLFTSMFLHGGFLHIIGNMFFLWMFGNQVENLLGKWVFTLVYLLSGLGGAGLHYVFNSNSTVPCIGASGAISGIVGCFFVLFPKARFDLVIYLGYWKVKEIPTHTHAAVGTWLAEQTLLGFISQAFKISAIAFWAHVGGFAIGSLSALVFLSVVPESKRRDAVAGPTWDMREETTKQDDELTILKL